ncbi:glutathione S-transferase [Flavimaricola marinus]|uniref:Putative GST-like protein YibF n=1 Tax=Flavimaricola marinus TaxID=1819565 RepID=A0A238LBJ0_9RHOB|nr:glutathione S-transferase [Flavimaricola marinus]SMY06998.1 putative GST-like protein YibF [Flavimaricola marinus]
MKLLISPASPFVRKARLLIREAGLTDRVQEVEVSTTPLATDTSVMAANPIGKIPALLRGDGPAIYDSRVITRYLDALAGGKFYPEARIWEVLTLEATADGIMDAAVNLTYEGRFRTPEMQSAAWMDAQWGKASRGVSAINERWMSHLSGPLDISHMAVACALSYLDLRHDARGWRAGNDALAAWHASFSERASMVATKPG